jgi:hypothetical protein
MICSEGQWGECVGTHVQRRTTAPGTRLLSIGKSEPCGATDICNPYCYTFEESPDPAQVDPADDVTIIDEGVTLKQIEGGSGPTCESLSISPATGTLNITQFSPILPKTVQFSATVVPADCFPGAAPVLWAIDRFDIATISAAGLVTLVTPIAGPIQVTAYAGALTATAVLNVSLSVVAVDSAITDPIAALFTSGTGAADPSLVPLYPYANTVFPLGLGSPLIQWRDTSALTVSAVKISLRYPAVGTPIFQWSQVRPQNSSLFLDPPTNAVPLAAGPRATIPQAVWQAFERVAKGGTGAYVIQRITSTSPPLTRVLRTERVVPIKFATNQLKGTVYYQSYGTNLVRNYKSTYQNGGTAQTYARADRKFGAATLAIQPGATYPTVAAGYTDASADGTGCRVCHTASANGSTLITNWHLPARNSARYLLGTDLPAGGSNFTAGVGLAYPSNNGVYAWPAIYPDGSFLFSNSGPGPDYSGTAPPGGLEGSADTTAQNRLYSLASATLGRDISPATTGYPTGLRAATPVFSPVGNRLAFNHYAGSVTNGAVTSVGDKRSLAMMDFTPATKTFSNFRRLVTESTSACNALSTDPCTIVWPSFMPANAGVVYEREIFNNGRVTGATQKDFGGTRSGCGDGALACSNDGTRAELWWVSLDSTPTARRLNAANGLDAANALAIPTGDTSAAHTAANEPVLNYEPTVNPQAVGGYYWVAFTSRRLYGNVATMNPWWSDPRSKPLAGSLGATTKKIWVAAISENPAENTDPSAPAFYLPGQEYLAGNSKAYWVLEACRAPSSTRSTANVCESDLDCCGAPTTSVCSLQTPIADPPTRHCVPNDASACIVDASPTQCFSDAQCCGFATGSRCANGTCQVPPPLSLYQPGTFVRDFESTCAAGKLPIWQYFEWQAELPVDTTIEFTATTADSTSDLATAVSVSAGTAEPPSTTTWTNDGTNIADQLNALNVTSKRYLRVTASLSPSEDELSAPILENWRVFHDCVDSQ